MVLCCVKIVSKVYSYFSAQLCLECTLFQLKEFSLKACFRVFRVLCLSKTTVCSSFPFHLPHAKHLTLFAIHSRSFGSNMLMKAKSSTPAAYSCRMFVCTSFLLFNQDSYCGLFSCTSSEGVIFCSLEPFPNNVGIKKNRFSLDLSRCTPLVNVGNI